MIRLPDGQMRRIYIIAVEGNTVRLAIEAPDYVEIIREELLPAEARREWDLQQGQQRRRVRKLPTGVIVMATTALAAAMM